MGKVQLSGSLVCGLGKREKQLKLQMHKINLSP